MIKIQKFKNFKFNSCFLFAIAFLLSCEKENHKGKINFSSIEQKPIVNDLNLTLSNINLPDGVNTQDLIEIQHPSPESEENGKIKIDLSQVNTANTVLTYDFLGENGIIEKRKIPITSSKNFISETEIKVNKNKVYNVEIKACRLGKGIDGSAGSTTFEDAEKLTEYFKTPKNCVIVEDIDQVNIQQGLVGFLGSFDGQNKTIKNLILNPTKDTAGLFRKAENVTIKNITIETLKIISDKKYTGGLVGYLLNNANVENITVKNANLTLNGDHSGGLFGASYILKNAPEGTEQKINNLNFGTEDLEISTKASSIGAIAGEFNNNKNPILITFILRDIIVGNDKKSILRVNPNSTANFLVGGCLGSIIGGWLSKIEVNLDIEAKNNSNYLNVGGIMGVYSGRVSSKILLESSFFNGKIDISGSTYVNVGGLVGRMDIGENQHTLNQISMSYAKGSIIADNSAKNVGGLVGVLFNRKDSKNLQIKESYSTLTLSNPSIGSIIGGFENNFPVEIDPNFSKVFYTSSNPAIGQGTIINSDQVFQSLKNPTAIYFDNWDKNYWNIPSSGWPTLK